MQPPAVLCRHWNPGRLAGQGSIVQRAAEIRGQAVYAVWTANSGSCRIGPR